MSNDKLAAALRELLDAMPSAAQEGADMMVVIQRLKSAKDDARQALAAHASEQAQAAEPVAYADPADLAKDGNWDTLIVKHASEWREGLRFKTPLYTSPQAMTPEQEREKFEAWAKDHVLDRQGDGYWSSHTQLMWMAWQARAALAGGTK